MESTPLQPEHHHQDPASASSKQSRKLQLRKAGFKAKDVPHRNVTPRTSDSWTKATVPAALSAKHTSVTASAVLDSTSQSGVLREISNSSRRRKKQPRPKVDESSFIRQDENADPSPKPLTTVFPAVAERTSKTSSPSPVTKSKSPNKSTPASRLRQRSVSLENVKYIEHLESELAAVQTQLAAMTSPTVMQARSLKMRALNAETRALQDEVLGWEHKFHERVQEEIEERSKVETGLKARIRLLEGDAEDYAQRIRTMQSQLEKRENCLSAAEVANGELERRIEALSDLIVSPKKSEVERAQELATRRHSRQKSLLPRLPTTGSLQMPSRLAATPLTPSTTAPSLLKSALSDDSDGAPSPGTQVNRDALAALTGGASGDRPKSPLGPQSAASSLKRFSWATPECYTSLDSIAASTGRPSRRMRRFHAGSVMPKPLLLPSTAAACTYNIPASAPPLEKEQTPPSFPFPDLQHLVGYPPTRNFDFLLSPMPGNGRRRALTCIEDVAAAMRRSSNPFVSPIPFPAAMAKSSKSSTSSDNPSTDRIVADVSSLGMPPIGRNLFDELRRAKEDDPSDVCDSVNLGRTTSNSTDVTERQSNYGSIRFSDDALSHAGRCSSRRKHTRVSHQRTISDQTGMSAYRAALLSGSPFSSSEDDEDDEDDEEADVDLAHALMAARQAQGATSSQGFYAVLAAFWRQTYHTATYCLAYAQDVSINSVSVRTVQLWLVQMVLGPTTTGLTPTKPSSKHASSSYRRRAAAAASRKAKRSSQSRSPAPEGADESRLGAGGRVHRIHRARPAEERELAMVDRVFVWIGRHNPWVWLRFSIALLFAIGAAIRDGPALVLGLEGRVKCGLSRGEVGELRDGHRKEE